MKKFCNMIVNVIRDKDFWKTMKKDFMILGKGVKIGKECIFDKVKSTTNQGLIRLGDYNIIHENCQFYISNEEFQTGDYCTFHKNTLVTGYRSCKIGHNFG